MRNKVRKGGLAVVTRQLFSLPINALGILFVSRLLSPEDFGVRATLVPVISLAVVLIDLGISQALVQSRTKPSLHILQRVQIIRLMNTGFIVVLFFLVSKFLVGSSVLIQTFLLLIPACGVVGWLQSQRAYQAVALQRQVDWTSLARIEMVEIMVYNVTLVVTAFLLRSAWCFIFALAMRMALGSVLLYYTTKSKELDFVNSESDINMQSLLRFGIPLQSTVLISILINAVNPIVIGSTLGLVAVGLINWSIYLVSLPLLPLQAIPAFLFSVLSERRREDRDDQEIVAGFTYLGTFLIATISLLVILSMDILVSHIFGSQWEGAIPIVSILLLGNVFYFPRLVIVTQLNASGHTGTYFLLTMLEVVLVWLSALIGSIYAGVEGYAFAVLAASGLLLIIQCYVANRLGVSRVFWGDSVRAMFYISLSMWSIAWLIKALGMVSRSWVPVTLPFVTIVIFGGFLFLVERNRLRANILMIRKLLWGSDKYLTGGIIET